MKKNTEIIAPAGSWESLNAAIKAGADSIYFGIDKLNMRARAAKPFYMSDLKEISKICKQNRIKCYLALNTIIYDDEMDLMRTICDAAREANVSAIIATDISTILYARQIGLLVHISTQANISNLESVRFYSQFSDVLVLARELTLPQIAYICDEIIKQDIRGPSGELVQIELFVHGALCVSIAGKCYMSLALTNHSANRGDCLQNCRRSYRVIDDTTENELKIDNRYVMSPKDLCTIDFLDQLLEAGPTMLKIEGRGRSSDYVFKVTQAYRKAIDSYMQGNFTREKSQDWKKDLQSVFNRGFWEGGYYLGKKLGEWSGAYGSCATKQKKYVGFVKNYFSRPKIVQIMIENEPLQIGDQIMATGPTTGYAETDVKSIYINEKSAKGATKGDDVTIPFPEKLRRNDKIYIIRDRTHWQK
ncbi:MAG: U32 family peptidase [Actinobacteria bacterium]|nr:U32 family peptidase [Actinomycetota bacterium]